MEFDNNKHKLDTLTLWWLDNNGQEVEKIATSDATYRLNGEKYGFVTEFDRTKKELINAVNDAIPYLDYIYVYTNAFSKKHELLKLLPDEIGIFSECDDCGLGMILSVQKVAKKLRGVNYE